MNTSDWPAIVAAMRAGGYYDRIMAGGAELDRVKEYLRCFAGERAPANRAGGMDPKYPCFPGLGNRPLHDGAGFAPAAALEAAWTPIRDEALALGEAAELNYTIASRPIRSLRRPWTYLKRSAPPRAWTVYPLDHKAGHGILLILVAYTMAFLIGFGSIWVSFGQGPLLSSSSLSSTDSYGAFRMSPTGS